MRISTFFQNFRYGYTQFPCQDLGNARTAETALTASHTGTRTAFNTVNCFSSAGRFDSSDNLRFRDRFTTTDNTAIQSIFFNKLCLLLM